ncbi:UNVERIFIED_CONTAM: hypothetical protein GTU68_049862 [Idotea baltica]|nr:hypothetical protein [Idotea baltica]
MPSNGFVNWLNTPGSKKKCVVVSITKSQATVLDVHAAALNDELD